MDSKCLKYFLILSFLLFENVVSQYEEEYEEGDDESEGEVNVPVTAKIDPVRELNFTADFQSLASQVDAAEKNGTLIKTKANTTVKFTTKRPRPRSTTELNRGQQIGSSVNGILNSVGALDIPGIVDNALSIRDDEPVREFVTGLMKMIFCSPILNAFSTCGDRVGINNRRPKPVTTPPAAASA